jgi:hypothetical protein
MKPNARALWNRIPSTVFLAALLLLGFALRVAYLTEDRFHADEALYAGWALLIPDGDPLLLSVPVDKPPLYLYTLAGSLGAFGRSEVAARLPGLASSVLGIALCYRLGRRLYGQGVGTLAALFLALSPFDILFARTTFTDSMLVMWMLAALYAVSAGRWLVTGLALGLAFATKQHALFLVPLVLAVGWTRPHAPAREGSRATIGCLPDPPDSRSSTDTIRRERIWRGAKGLLACALGFAFPLAGVIAWDSARWADRPGYWHQSALSYGGLVWAPFAGWGERLVEWAGWSRYLAGSPVLAILLVAGIIALLAHGWRRHPGDRRTWLDTTFVAYALGYLVAHVVLRFSVWDRYLLPLAPLTALLLARIVVWIGQGARRGSDQSRQEAAAANHFLRVLRVSVVSFLFLSALLSAWKAAHNGYPIGGEHWAYQGLDQVAAYLEQNAPPGAVLYHHWLRWHYSYYLYDAGFELRWWESEEHLRREALRTPERAQYIVLPDWRTLEPDVEGIAFQPLYQAHRRDGSVSLTVYRVEPQQLASPIDRTEKGSE